MGKLIANRDDMPLIGYREVRKFAISTEVRRSVNIDLAFPVWCGTFFLIGLLVSNYLVDRLDYLGLAVGYGAWFVAGFCLLTVLRLATVLNYMRTFVFVELFVALAVVFAIIADIRQAGPVIAIKQDSMYGLLLVVAAESVLSVFTVVNLSLASVFLVNKRSRAHAMARNPSACALIQLFRCVTILVDEKRFSSLSGRRLLVRALRDAAHFVEKGLWRQIPVYDTACRVAYIEQCRSCAHALRSYQGLVALAGKGTREELLENVNGAVYAIWYGYLQYLPVKDAPSIVTLRQRLRLVMVKFWALSLGALPLVVIFGARVFGVDLPGLWNGGLVAAGVVWFLLTFIGTFDAFLLQRVAAFKDLAGALAQFKQSK
ncbi:hypothetical protein [Saccharothrix texasensis]|nr:hypothetical protein [Saccharothrix texasensis]